MTRRTLACLVPLAVPACDSPISNRVFYEDAEFLAAVPSFREHAVRVPGMDADTEPAPIPLAGGAPDLLAQGAAVAAGLTASLEQLALLGDFIRAQEPSVREDDVRSWGPASLENGTRALLLADIIRSGLGQYDWAFQLSNSSGGPWDAFYLGTHFAGATVAEGDGFLEADMGLLASYLGEEREGVAECTYDLRDGTRLEIALLGYREQAEDAAFDAHYRYFSGSDGAGDFQYGLETDFVPGAQLERSGVRERWDEEGAVRADARLEGGDLGETSYTLSQCWDADGVLVYQEDNLGIVEVIGESWACAFRKASYPEPW